jgi:hypothetical protein
MCLANIKVELKCDWVCICALQGLVHLFILHPVTMVGRSVESRGKKQGRSCNRQQQSSTERPTDRPTKRPYVASSILFSFHHTGLPDHKLSCFPQWIAAVFTCTILTTNRRTITCSICLQRAWGFDILSFADTDYNYSSTHFRKNTFLTDSKLNRKPLCL